MLELPDCLTARSHRIKKGPFGRLAPPPTFETTVVLFLRSNNKLDTSLEKIISLSHFHQLPSLAGRDHLRTPPSNDCAGCFLRGFRTMVRKEKGLYKTHLFPLASSLIRSSSAAEAWVVRARDRLAASILRAPTRIPSSLAQRNTIRLPTLSSVFLRGSRDPSSFPLRVRCVGLGRVS